MSNSTVLTEQDALAQRWLEALLQLDATLPRPIAEAMARNTMRGTAGDALCQLDTGLRELETINVRDLTGSEARTLLAVLLQMSQRVVQLEANIRQLWDSP